MVTMHHLKLQDDVIIRYKCQRLSDRVLVLSPTIQVGPSELECSGGKNFREMASTSPGKQTDKQTNTIQCERFSRDYKIHCFCSLSFMSVF